MSIKKTIIFDFDGTIADTLELGLDIYNKEIVPKFRVRKIKREQLSELRNTKPNKKILKEYNISYLKFLLMVFYIKSKLGQRIDEAEPQQGIIEVIKNLAEKGYELGILSSNSKKNIEYFLKKYKIRDCFSFVLCSRNVFGKHKTMNKISKDFIYIGDEVRDIEAAKKAGIESVAVAWGFNKREVLEKQNPDHLIEKPKQLLALL